MLHTNVCRHCVSLSSSVLWHLQHWYLGPTLRTHLEPSAFQSVKENVTKGSQWIKWLPKYLARWAEGSSFYSQVLGNKMKAMGLLRLRNKRWGGASEGFSRTDSGSFKKKLHLIARGTAKEVKKQVKFLSSHHSTLLLGCHTAGRLAICKVLAMYISQQQLQMEFSKTKVSSI